MYITIFKRALARFGQHQGTSFAAAIAYNAIFSIFPIILLAVAALGFFLHDPEQRRNLVAGLFAVLGRSVAEDALLAQVDAVAGGSVALGIVGIVAAAWSATGVFSQIRVALQIIWNSTRPRPIVQQKLVDAAMLFSAGLLILLSLTLTAVLTALERFAVRILGAELGAGLHALLLCGDVALPAAFSFVAFSLLYWWVPRAGLRLRDVWLGALAASVAFEIVQLLFAYYVAGLGHYAQTYGALGGIIAFMFFVYLTACIILIGAEVTREHTALLAANRQVAEPQPRSEHRSRSAMLWEAIKSLFVNTSTDT